MRTLIGVVKDGVIVLEGGVTLPEGTRVRIEIVATEPVWTPKEEEEFAAWERANNVAWSLQ
ncbi:MAG: hypothetical protein ACK4I8_00100 [Armatimonadota bacterium]